MVSMDRREAVYRGPDIKIFIRDVSETKKRSITVRSWSTVKDVKDTIKELIHVPTKSQRLYFGPLLASGGDLPNHRTLHDAGIYRSGETLLLEIQGKNQQHRSSIGGSTSTGTFSPRNPNANDVTVFPSMSHCTSKPLRNLVQQARRGFAVGLKPEFVLDGSGGTYFVHDARKNKIAVFKPADEEPYAENNPRGYIQEPGLSLCMREGVVPGEACIREVAAFLLDHDSFSGVPLTTLAEARHPAFNTNGSRLSVAAGGACIGSHSITPSSDVSTKKKVGSFQEFVRAENTMDDISTSKISVEQVHKIAILDIRIMNADRNSANLLVRRLTDDSLELVPIDHGYCLRPVCDVSWMDWCWLDWPQLKQPLSEYHKKYIASLDIEADAQLLRDQLNIGQEAIDYFRASSALLKAGVKAGLTLYDIALLCCRNDNLAEVPSMMENLFSMASELAHAAVENDRWHHSEASSAIVDQLTPQRRATLKTFPSSGLPRRASTAGFLSLASSSADSFLGNQGYAPDEEEVEEDVRASPAMAVSSMSDSTSEASEIDLNEDVECEEWAANVIADATADPTILPPTGRNGRSGSVGSDDASSDDSCAEKKGFWHVPPGSSPVDTAASDDGSTLSWSPQSSPRPSLDSGKLPASLAVCELPATTTLASPFTRNVTFCSQHPLVPPKTVDVSTEPPPLPPFFLMKQESNCSNSTGMTRSKSYSSLPRGSAANQERSAAESNLKPYTEAYQNYRKYFHKFIDLVIVRETAAAVRQQSARVC